MVVSLPRIALIATASIGIIAAIKGFRGFEMLLMMIVASVLGGLLNSTTDWAWIAPFLPAGFMLSVALENAIREKS